MHDFVFIYTFEPIHNLQQNESCISFTEFFSVSQEFEEVTTIAGFEEQVKVVISLNDFNEIN